jgi:hypothetical protein
MFSLFGSPKLKCPRCHHKSVEGTEYCAQCGLLLSASRHEPVPREKASGPLITRQPAFALQFDFDDLHTSEFMAIAAKFSAQLKLDNADAFTRCFMAAPDAITATQLQQLLEPTVRQIALEFVGAQSLREMQDNRDLRQQLDERLLSGLNLRIVEYGLTVTQVTTLEVRHDKICFEREKLGEKIGTLWLVVDAKRALIDHGKRLDALYSEKEWQKISHEEEQIRLRYRREELRQKFGKDLGWLYLHGEAENARKRLSRAKLKQDENERLQVIRVRELELYGRIIDAGTRKEAIDRGAGEAIKELEHNLKEKSEQRQNAADLWLHVRTLARIKMRTESEITQLEGKQSAQLMHQQLSHQLQKNQLQHQISQAQLLDDQTQARAQIEVLKTAQKNLSRHEQELAEEEQKGRLISVSIETEAKAREFQRLQAWEEELHAQKTRELQREDSIKECDIELKLTRLRENIGELKRVGSQADALAQQEKLLRTLDAHAIFEKQMQQQRHQADLDKGVTEKMHLQSLQDDDHCRWQRELEKHDLEHSQSLARLRIEQEHEVTLARLAIERINVIANLSETGKIASIDAPNALALAEILKLQAQAGMSAEQILASQAGQSAHAAQAMSAMASAQNSSNKPAANIGRK